MSDGKKFVLFDGSRRRPDPRHVAEFAAIARKLQQEREAAAKLVEEVLRETPSSSWPQLAARAELHSSGVIERLGAEVEARLDTSPRDALLLAELETAIADALSPDGYPAITLAQSRAHAWKDLGQALSYVGRYEEALEALARAEEQLAAFVTLAHDRAIVQFVRATTLQEISRHNESFALLTACKGVFREHGDARRGLLCGIAEGALLHRLQKHREAREAYLMLLDTARALNDSKSLACLHNVIGHCSVSIADYDAAERHLSLAVQLFMRLEQPLLAAKAELARGRALLRRGQHDRAIRHLAGLRDQFLRHELVEEAGLCGLDIVEAHLRLGAAAEAETLARRIVVDFTAARLNERAVVALGYLAEAIAERESPLAMVQKVREYIHALRKTPEREFVAFA